MTLLPGFFPANHFLDYFDLGIAAIKTDDILYTWQANDAGQNET